LAVEETTQRREFPDDRFEVVPREQTRRSALLVLVGLVLVFIAFRVWLATEIVTPWILIDELVYADLARSVAEEGSFHVRGEPFPWYNFGYAALIAPAWVVAEAQSSAFTLAKTINVSLGVLALLPVFFWARRLTTSGYALLAVGLSALMPSLLYAGTLMSENGFLPVFLLATLVIAWTLERPSLRWQALTFAAIALASLIRLQGVILLAVLPTAVVLASILEARLAPAGSRLDAARRYLVRFWPTAAALVLLVVAYAAIKAAQGQSLSTGLGSYRIVAESDYALADSARWVARHLADLALATGMFPVSAFIVLVGLSLLRGAPSAAERAFLATAFAAIGWIVPQAALFATNFAFRIEERYMFCVFPLLFVGLALWLYRGAPRRPWPLAALAAALPAAAIIFALPLRSLLRIEMISDTFGLIPLLRLSQLLSGGTDTVATLVVLAALGAGALFLLVPRRFVALLPVGIALLLIFSSYAVHGATRDYAEELKRATYGQNRSWLDGAVGPNQAIDYVYGGGTDLWFEATKLWQSELWNRSLDDVYNIGVAQPVGVVEVQASIDPASGRIALLPQDVPPDRFVVADERLGLAGQVLRRHGQLALYRLDPPARLRQTSEGVYSDAWIGSAAALTQFTTPGNRPVQLHLTLSRQAWGGPDIPGRVTVRLGTVVKQGRRAAMGKVTESRTWVAHSGKARSFVLRTPLPPFRVELNVSPTFSPSEFGLNDTRQLGVQVAFELRRASASG
jgi:hypothetical protein